ncbi:MAG TPA: hypothetical protein VF662_10740 [Allosphingosinicella sp.]|jgi:hypothetical protein
MLRPSLLAAFALLAAASPALAEGPEQIQGLGPKKGEWLLNYTGQFGSARGTDAARQHSGQSFYGLSDRIAIGGETQLGYRSGPLVKEDRLYFDYDSVIALVRFSDAEKDPIGTGFWLQAALDSDGEVARLEARGIVEKKTPTFHAEGNLMLRRVNEEEQEGTYIAYAGRLSWSLGQSSWIGAEVSGQAARLGGFGKEPLEKEHYLGPSIRHEIELGRDKSLELGLSYLRRIDSDEGLRSVFQLTGELRF